MKKRKTFQLLTFTGLLLVLLSCGEEDVFITFPSGEYLSDCSVSGSDGIKTEFIIERSFRSQTTQEIVFTGSTDCSGASSTPGAKERTDIRFIFSNEDLGNNVSFFTNEVKEGGEDILEYHAFHFQRQRLLISPSLRDVKEADLKTEFADFIEDPEQHAELFLNRVD